MRHRKIIKTAVTYSLIAFILTISTGLSAKIEKDTSSNSNTVTTISDESNLNQNNNTKAQNTSNSEKSTTENDSANDIDNNPSHKAPDDNYNEDDCSLLFGSEKVEIENEKRREKLLANVIESNGIVTVLHHAKHWSESAHAHGLGMDLVTIEKDEDDDYIAFFDVTDEIAEYYGCESGIYEVSQDASLFSKAPILWISKNFILLEYDGQLTYITPDRDTRYIFRLVWQSSWTIQRPKQETSSRKSRRHRRSRRR